MMTHVWPWRLVALCLVMVLVVSLGVPVRAEAEVGGLGIGLAVAGLAVALVIVIVYLVVANVHESRGAAATPIYLACAAVDDVTVPCGPLAPAALPGLPAVTVPLQAP